MVGDAALELSGVTKAYGETRALSDVSLEVRPGELFCVLGPSGAGKTTLLRSIAGLEQLDAGTVRIAGEDVTDRRPGRREVAMFFENLSLYPHKSVFENLAFPLRRRRTPAEEVDRRVSEVAELLGMDYTLRRRPATLSGGERQRVALGRALIRRAALFLLDEPLSNLDALLRLHMRSELKRLQRELGHTTVYATPDPLEALALADRICVLDHGVIQQVGPPAQIYRRPANQMVATFVGNPPMNLIPCSIDGSALVSEHFRLELGRGRVDGPARVLLGVRPEDVSLAGTAGQADAWASVFALEPLGSKTIVDLMLGDTLIKSATRGRVDMEIGTSQPLVFNKRGLHVIELESGRVLTSGPEEG